VGLLLISVLRTLIKRSLGDKQSMELIKAIALQLGESNKPVVTEYDLGVIVSNLYRTKKFKGERIKTISKDFPSKRILLKNIAALLSNGVIQRQDTYFTVLGKKNYGPGEIMCSLDPFAYVSHISAMSFHGLTDRIPSSIYLSTPNQKRWREFARERMEKDYGDKFQEFSMSTLPKLTRPHVEKVGKFPVHIYSSVHAGAFKHVSDSILRVSTIGRTFLDMLREPMLCGGMRHVMNVYKEHGKLYKTLIIDELNQHGNKIEKVRAGYLLEELCNLRDERIDEWLSNVERGGSRKLDPSAEYRPTYSERWCLSINVD